MMKECPLNVIIRVDDLGLVRLKSHHYGDQRRDKGR